MATTRDLLNPILKHAPVKLRPARTIGAVVVAFLAALNPLSYFTSPYIGAVAWLILAWWFYNENPYNLIKREGLIPGNPRWYQVMKSLAWGLLMTPIPVFFIYLTLLLLARMDSKMIQEI